MSFSESQSDTVPVQLPNGAVVNVELSKPLLDHPCVLLDLHEEPVANGQGLYAYGYLRSDPHAAPVHLIHEGWTGDQPPLLKFKEAQIEPGISGAALLNLRSRQVCGMVVMPILISAVGRFRQG